jgi:peroxin-11B
MDCEKLIMTIIWTRKSTVMRLGKPLEHLQAALKVTKEISDPVVGVCAVGRQISYAIYLFNDMMIWVRFSISIKFRSTSNPNLTCSI